MPPAEPRVLVIDDELNVRKTLAMLLERNKYQASTAASAEEGLRLLKTLSVDDHLRDGSDPLRHRAGEPVQRGLDAEPSVEVVRVHRHDRRRVEVPVEPRPQAGRRGERHLHRDLLVEQHPEQSGEGVIDEKLVGFGVAGHRKRVRSHGV